ncbi:MAG: redoxin domain-containing protein [Flavobacteriales bacterium]
MRYNPAHLIYTMLLMALLASCTKDPHGVLSGNITGAGGKKIYLQSLSNQPELLDSAMIGSDGTFSLIPSRGLRMDYYQLFIDQKHSLFIITDSTENIEFNGDFQNMDQPWNSEGSTYTAELRTARLGLDSLADEYFKALDLSMASDSASAEAKADLVTAYSIGLRKLRDHQAKLLNQHLSSPVFFYLTIGLNELYRKEFAARMDKALLQQAVSNQEKVFGHMYFFEICKNLMMNIAPLSQSTPGGTSSVIAVGQPAPEIALPDPQGVTRKLSDLKGKIVLIDFWASWCTPCRRENPAVKALYKKYNALGFEIFSVSLDRMKEEWVAAIEQDGLPWPNHVSDLKYWDCAPARLYQISSIPSTVLIDREGKIIATNLRGPILESKLAEVFKGV